MLDQYVARMLADRVANLNVSEYRLPVGVYHPPPARYYFSMRVGEPVTSIQELELIAEKAKVNLNGQIFRQHLYSISGTTSIRQVDPDDLTEVADWIRERYHSKSAPMLRGAAQVFPFRKKPKHFTTIGGDRYVLSDFGGHMMADVEDDDGDREDGAQLVDLGSRPEPFRFLWVLNTDTQIVECYRVTDGSLKAHGHARQMTRDLVKLETSGELNRVGRSDAHAIARYMGAVEQAHLEALQRSIEDSKDDFQRVVDGVAREVFDRQIRPEVEDRLSDLDRGVYPFGFQPTDSVIPKDRQARSYVVGQVLRKYTAELVDAELVRRGYDPSAPGVDSQASYWAVHDVLDAFYASLDA